MVMRTGSPSLMIANGFTLGMRSEMMPCQSNWLRRLKTTMDPTPENVTPCKTSMETNFLSRQRLDKNNNESVQIGRRLVAFVGHNHLADEDMEDTIMRGYLRKVAGSLCACLHHSLPGPLHQFHLALQQCDEVHLHRLRLLHHLSHLHEVQGHL